MGALFEAVEIIQERIEKESHRTWLYVIEEVKHEFDKKGKLNENK